VALAAQKLQVPLAPKAAAQLRSGSMLVAMATAEPLPASRQPTHPDSHGANVST
jgi:hypothetical protein